MIRGIIFDCFGVLYGGSLSLLASMAPEGRAEEVYDINMQKDYGYISYPDYLTQTADVLAVSPDEVDRIIHEKHVRNQELVAYVRELKQQGESKVGLLSNIGEQVIQELFGAELNELFDTVVLSYEEGIAKPNPGIFTLMAERIGVPAWECVMIDDLEDNCDGAEIAGMQSIRHITNASTIKQIEAMRAKSA